MEIGRKLAKALPPGSVVTLTGTLGAGKTTLVKGVAEGLNIEEPVTSPTYTIVCEYAAEKPLYHMDLYRLSGPDEFEQLGLEKELYGNGLAFIEWGERAEEVLPTERINLHIEVLEDNSRIISIQGAPFELP